MTGAHASSSSYRVLRQLGARAHGTHAAIRGAHDLVVVQRFRRSPNASATEAIAREARCLSKNWHPNVARVRHVDIENDELVVATEFVDGLTLEELIAAAASRRGNGGGPVLPPPVVTRIVLDVLVGLQHLHGLRDETTAPLGAFHGALCPTNIVVGRDGVARLIAVFRPLPVNLGAEKLESLGYAAPESLEEDGPVNAATDLYGSGVILWELLQGKRLFDQPLPSQILVRQREAEIPWACEPNSAVARLGPIALKAIAFDPALRLRTASELVAAIRRAAGTEIATGSAVAQKVVELGGDRIRARRLELDERGSVKAIATKPLSPSASSVVAAKIAGTKPPATNAAPSATAKSEPKVSVAPPKAPPRAPAVSKAPPAPPRPPPPAKDSLPQQKSEPRVPAAVAAPVSAGIDLDPVTLNVASAPSTKAPPIQANDDLDPITLNVTSSPSPNVAPAQSPPKDDVELITAKNRRGASPKAPPVQSPPPSSLDPDTVAEPHARKKPPPVAAEPARIAPPPPAVPPALMAPPPPPVAAPIEQSVVERRVPPARRTTPLLQTGIPVKTAIAIIATSIVVTLLFIGVIAVNRKRMPQASSAVAASTRTVANAAPTTTLPQAPPTATDNADAATPAADPTNAFGSTPAAAPDAGSPDQPAVLEPTPAGPAAPRRKTSYEPLGI
jgi:serine/threonine protein kinase